MKGSTVDSRRGLGAMAVGSISDAAVIGTLAVLPLLIPDSSLGSWLFRLSEVYLLSTLALSFDFLLGHARLLSLGHVLFFGGAGYAFAILSRSAGFSVTAALVSALALAAVLGLVVGGLSYRVSGIQHAMVAFALADISATLVVAPEIAGTTGGTDGIRDLSVHGLTAAVDHRVFWYYLCLGVLSMSIVGLRTFLAAPRGRALVAIGMNPLRAAALGYPVNRYRLAAFVVAAIWAGVAGAMTTILESSSSPSRLGFMLLGTVIVGAVLGGSGSVLGPVLGTLAVSLGQDGLRDVFGSSWALIYAMAGILVLVAFPAGIAGVLNRLRTS